MKPLTRNILYLTLGALLTFALIALVALSRRSHGDDLCNGVKITIHTDSAGVLAEKDIQDYMLLNIPTSTGRSQKDIDLTAIEQQLVEMPLVSSAECYLDNKGFLRVDVTEMVPVMHVLGGNHDYCIDIDGNQMPTPQRLRRGVAHVDGANVSLQFATTGLYNLILYLQQNGWSSEFSLFRVGAGNKVSMKSSLYGYWVVVGVPEGYVRKLDKLTRFRLSEPQHAKYNEINLDYYGQVVCK